MKLVTSQAEKNHHKEAVTACCWSPNYELYTCSDDKTIAKWNMDGECLGKVCDMDSYATDMHWLPSVGRQPADHFIVACTDGTFRIFSKSGRQEQKVEASKAAVISLRWNYEGSAIAVAAEDGSVKIWSRNGMLRSVLATAARAAYAVCWGPDSEQILYATGNEVVTQSVQVDRKQLKWKAHDGVVMAVDWNPVNNMIVTGGEDCIYKVWDPFGRQLFQSQPFEHVVTSVAWSFKGDVFAVGSFNTLRLCDKTGWSYSRERPSSGSLYKLAWTPDATQLAGAGGNGSVVFGQLIGRTLEWNNIEVTLVDSTHILVQDVANETAEKLDYRDKVIEMALGFGYLILAKPTQCYIYTIPNWNTPHMFDIRASAVSLIVQSEKHFVLVDAINGIQVYTYDGRVLSTIRYPGLRAEFMNTKTISLSPDSVAILDQADSKVVRMFDIRTGRALGAHAHNLDILEIALSQYAEGVSDRKLAFIDTNRDLYVTPITAPNSVKLHTMVDCVIWNDTTDMMAALADGELVTWMYPGVVFIDKDLLEATKSQRTGTEFGKMPQLATFFGSRLTVRRSDGALMTASLSVYPPVLYEFVSNMRWEEAVRLCRFVKSPGLWTCLAAMALTKQHLDTAEVALSAINEVDKLHYIKYIKDIPSNEGRAAELALYRRQPEEAEAILLQASPPLVYRAIKMNIRLFRWNRALSLAVERKTHVDTVLGYRQRYLRALNKQETDPRFEQYAAEVAVDWDTIKAKTAQERERENERAGISGGAGGGAGAFDHK